MFAPIMKYTADFFGAYRPSFIMRENGPLGYRIEAGLVTISKASQKAQIFDGNF